jgi:GAF domain-containing protein
LTDDYLKVLSSVNSRASLPVVYASCHEALAARMPAADMYISLVEGDKLRFPYYVDRINAESTLTILPREGWTGYVLDRAERYWMSVDPPPPDGVAPIGTVPSDWLGVPLVDRGGAPIGVLAVQTYEPGASYGDDDVAFVEFVAGAVSLAVQLATQDRELAIRRIAALVDDALDLRDLYAGIHEIMKSVLPASRRNIVIAKVDEDAGMFRPVYWRDEKDDFDALPWTLDSGFCGYIYGHLKSSFVFEAGKVPIPPEVRPIGYPPKYWLGAPLLGRDRIIGVVIVQSYDQDEAITKEDQYTLDGICPYIAEAIGATELFQRSRRL